MSKESEVVVFAGQGDMRRSMALLWRREGSTTVRTGPGRKPALSVDAIVDAAIAVADKDGLPALSMRAVGERLGHSAMALYTYVPSKNELIDLMYDRALADLPAQYEMSGWRAALTAWTEDLCAFYVRHPWVLQVSTARPVLGPNEYVLLNTVVGILYRTELRPGVLRRIVGLLFHFVRGAAQTIAESREAPTATGVSDEEWWSSHSMLMEEFAPDFAKRFPMVIRLESDRPTSPDDEPLPAELRTLDVGDTPYLEYEARETFRVGLAVLLDGIEAARRRKRKRT